MSINKLDRRQQTENLRNVRFNEKDDVNVADLNWLIDQINANPGGGTELGPGVSITVCDITLENNPPTLAPVQSFNIAGTANPGDPPTGFANILFGQLAFVRATTGGIIYNPFGGEVVPGPLSPADTEWNSSFTDPAQNGFADLSNLDTRVYDTFTNALNGAVEANIIGLELMMRHIPSGRLYAITFTGWDDEVSTPYGGFAFDMQVVLPNPPCRVTFSDGTYLETAPVSTINTDRVLVPGVAFVHPAGDNNTAMVGDGNLPFQSVDTAASRSNYVVLLPGVYTQTINIVDGVTYAEMPGVIHQGGKYRDTASTGKKVKIIGNGVWTANSDGLEVLSDAEVLFQFDKMDNNRTVLVATSSAKITMSGNSILCHGLNGFGGAMTIRDDAEVNMTINNFFHGQHNLAYFRAGATPFAGKFTITCPDMRILPNYQASYGNLAKSVFRFDQCEGAEFVFNGNMTLDHNVLGSGTTGCIGIDNHFVSNKITVNGDMSGGVANTCIWTGVRARVDDIVINGNMHADNNFVVYLTLTGGDGPEGPLRITFNGTKFTGDNFPLHIRDGKELYFRDCSFYNGDTQAGAESIQYVASNGLPSELYFYNCIAQNAASAVGAEFISGGAAIGILGCYNVICADPLGVGAVDTFAGYTQLAGVKTPNF